MANHQVTSALVAAKSASIVAIIVSSSDVQRVATSDLRKYLDKGRFFWLDLVGSETPRRRLS